ncbi:MAG TPA: phosphoadenylyl-sulfate reductase [Candidatus Binataceae bacterium]|nr:phosphoadenylyl-sulfate reductase [Candidatus Binataceae bacterium]
MEQEITGCLIDEAEVREAGLYLENRAAQDVLAWALSRFGRRMAICASFQSEACVLIDMAWRIDPNVRVFTIDTGRLPQETFDLIEQIRERYGIATEVILPEHEAVQKMVSEHGSNLFLRDVGLRLLCCQVRKVLPLKRALANLDAWVTGLRRDQTLTRSEIRKVEIDEQHGGIVKVSPLAGWTEREVWDYIRLNDVPYNALYERGYRSIGCASCTRAVAEGEDPRSGRWWWETGAVKECGMHCTIENGRFESELTAVVGARGV